jgi:hypothetical protein
MCLSLKKLARVQGFEPQHPESESGVLPLDDTRPLIPWDPFIIIVIDINAVKLVCVEPSSTRHEASMQ